MKQKSKGRRDVPPPAAVREWSFWAAPTLLAVIVLFFYWTPLTSASASIQWDAADMHYPLQKYVAERFRAGALPVWTPYLFSGYPILANPETSAWYPPHWPFFLLGITPLTIQMELALAAFLACFGAYLLLTRVVTQRAAAFTGALAYGLSGFFAGHSSHVGLFTAAAYLPWLLLAFRTAMDRGTLAWAAFGGIAGGFMILAGYVQTSMYGFLALGLYAVSELAAAPKKAGRIVATIALMLGGALALAAVQILPGLELTAHSIRAGASYSATTESVLELRALATLLSPDALGALSGNYTGPFDITQYYFYGGMLLLPLAALGAARCRLARPALFVLVPAIWYMLGPAAGFYRLGALIPGLHQVRAPVQGWFVAGLALAMLAAGGCEWILGRWRVPYLAAGMAAFFAADLWFSNSYRNPLAYGRNSFEELYGAREQMGRDHVAAVQPPLSRFDAPRALNVMGPLDHPIDLKLESTYGYFALEPAAYDRYTEAMARNPRLRDGLNVSRVLNVQTGRIDPNPAVLPRAYYPQSVADAVSESASLTALESLNPAEGSIIFAPHAPIQQDRAAFAHIAAHDERSYRLRYRCASPSLLKLSVPWFPGWRAVSGGRDLPVLRVDHALMGVVTPAGEGEVEFRFASTYLTAGMGLSAAALLALGVLAYAGIRPAHFSAPADLTKRAARLREPV